MKTVLANVLGAILLFGFIYAFRIISKKIKEKSLRKQICEHCYNKIHLELEDIYENKYICPFCNKENNIVSL